MAEGEERKLVADVAGTSKFPTGFRFKPTDEELVEFYLLPRLQGRPTVPNNAIIEANVYEFNPATLVNEMHWSRGEDAWYFLSPRARIYQNGARPARKTEDGFGRWKSSTANKVVDDVTVGDGIRFCKNVLNYFVGTPKKEWRTKWLMKEFTIPEYAIKRGSNGGSNATLDEYVMCKIYVSPVHKATDDVGSTSAVVEEVEQGHVTAESNLSETKAGKRILEVQSSRCAATAQKQTRQGGSLTIGQTQADGAGNASVPAQPTVYNGQAPMQRPPIPTQFPPNVPTAYPNSYGQRTMMARPPNLGFPAPGTGFRPQVSLRCYYDHNYRSVLQPAGNAAYAMPQHKTMAYVPPQYPYFNSNPNDHAGASSSQWPPYNSNPYEGSLMAQVTGDQGEATAPYAGSGMRGGSANAEHHQFVELASINPLLAGAHPQTPVFARTELSTRTRSPQVETSRLHKQDTARTN